MRQVLTEALNEIQRYLTDPLNEGASKADLWKRLTLLHEEIYYVLQQFSKLHQDREDTTL